MNKSGHKVRKIFGHNLKRLRKDAGLSQEKLAELLDTSVPHISNVEAGKKFASAELIETIANVLEVSPSALFFDIHEEKKEKDDNLQSELEKVLLDETDLLKQRVRRKINDLL